MRILIVGADGYLGWSLGLRLRERGHLVEGIDNLSRRRWVQELGSDSAIPIPDFGRRVLMTHGAVSYGDASDYEVMRDHLRRFRPDAIVHLGEQPSAPFSMRTHDCAAWTLKNNLLGTLAILWAMHDAAPEAHLLKLATMGEYGTPESPIPEGFFPSGAMWIEPGDTAAYSLAGLLFPRRPGSYYHATKVQDTTMVEMACRLWGLRSTDVHQGVVYGTHVEEMGSNPELATRFDFDESFGTVINRFCAQAVCDLPLTPYGKGGQRRGYLSLDDSLQCMTLLLEHPPAAGEYRTANQLQEIRSVLELAELVRGLAAERGSASRIARTDNPRIEAEEHTYQVERTCLPALGFAPRASMEAVVDDTLARLWPHRDRIAQHMKAIPPKTRWDAQRQPEPRIHAAAAA